MGYRDLREFVARLEKEGELKRIRAEVDPILEITEVTQRIARDKNRHADSVGPALLFEKPKGSRVPLLVNRPPIRAPRRTTDVFASTLSALGIVAPPRLDGQSWL